MFGVTKLSNSTSASMKIVTYLNTNEEFRNLILYGVEGENYVWTDSDVLDANGNPYRVVQRLTKDAEDTYVMDALKTGNVALAYTALGEDPLIKQNILNHNFGLKSDFVLGFSFYDAVNAAEPKVDPELHKAYVSLNEFSAKTYEQIIAAKNEDELALVFKSINDEFSKPAMADLTSKAGGIKSHVDYYYSWLQSKGLYDPMA